MKRSLLILLLIVACFVANSQVSKSVIITGGGLAAALNPTEKATVTHLTISGSVDARDFKTMRDSMSVLESAALVGAVILPYSGTNGPLSPSNYSYLTNEIPPYAFCNPSTFIGKTTLKSISLPTGMYIIGQSAFYKCTGLTTVSNMTMVITIGSFAFSYCGNGLNITIPSTVTAINMFAFEAFNGIINVDPANEDYSSQDGVLFDFGKMSLIHCPVNIAWNYKIPSMVRSIESNAFSHCNSLAGTFRIPQGVKSVGNWAFRNCENITTLVIPESVESIGTGAFAECTDLTSIYSYNPLPVDLSHSSTVFYLINKSSCIVHVPYQTGSLYSSANQWQDFTNIEEMSDSYLPVNDFPYVEDFASGSLPYNWTITDHQNNGQVWVFNNPGGRTINTISHSNGFVIIDSYLFGSGTSQNCDLITSTFDFTYLTNIDVSFSHYFNYQSPSQARFYYSIDGGAHWVEKEYWYYSTTNPENYSTDLTAVLEGEKNVKFMWNFKGSFANYWAIDDFQVTTGRIAVAENLSVADTTINGYSACFDATDDITVAGSGSSVVIENGASSDFIAGNSIQFLEGFHAVEGCQMNASITTNSNFCYEVALPVVINAPIEKSMILEQEVIKADDDQKINVYPNPTSGFVKVELFNIENANLSIYHLSGSNIMQLTNVQSGVYPIDLSGVTGGIYLLKIDQGQNQYIKKIIVR